MQLQERRGDKRFRTARERGIGRLRAARAKADEQDLFRAQDRVDTDRDAVLRRLLERAEVRGDGLAFSRQIPRPAH